MVIRVKGYCYAGSGGEAQGNYLILGKQGGISRNKMKFSTGAYLCVRGMCVVNCKCGNVGGKS